MQSEDKVEQKETGKLSRLVDKLGLENIIMTFVLIIGFAIVFYIRH